MSPRWAPLRPHLLRALCIAVILLFYVAARLPELSPEQRIRLAARFRFTAVSLPEAEVDRDGDQNGDVPDGPTHVRAVNPSLERINAWISSVGAAIALADLDSDGLPNDYCHVDPRTDSVTVAPIPGTGSRFAPRRLTWAGSTDRSIAPMGCLPGDLNEDGFLDLVVYFWGRPPALYLHLRDPQTNSWQGYRETSLIDESTRWYTNAATLADLDGDGHLDLVFGNYFQDDAEILDETSDRRESMQHSMSKAFNGGRNRLLLWAEAGHSDGKDVRFEDASDALDGEVAHAWTLAIGAVDLDGDLLSEIYFANDFGPDRLLLNRSTPGHLRFDLVSGERGFTTPKSKVLGHDSFKGMGVDFGDLNEDGRLDIMVSNIATEYALEESHLAFVSSGDDRAWARRIAPYVESSEKLGLSRSGWAWDVRMADFDNDGVLEIVQGTGFVRGLDNRWPELHEVAMGNDELLSNPHAWPRVQGGDDLSGRQRNPFFVRADDGRYYDLSPELGIDTPYVTRGVATGDVDGDGDLDFVIANQWEPSVLFLNESEGVGSALFLRLLLSTENPDGGHAVRCVEADPSACRGRPAVGAAIEIRDRGRRFVSYVDGGGGHSGVRSPEAHIGLGKHPEDEPVEVRLRWRSSSGELREDRLELVPGHHTVLLGAKE